MRFTLLLVGKTTSAPLKALIEDYVARLEHYIPFTVRVLPELRQAKSLTQDQQKMAEGELILHALPEQADVILLDEHGSEYRSVEFAQLLKKKMSSSRDVYLVVGGPYGFSESVYQRANGMLSLSRMTFSHQMIRLLIVEQLYRAMTILRGEPYHHE